MPEQDARFQAFLDVLSQHIEPYEGKVSYGNLRFDITEWEENDGTAIHNLAIVYETPGGSTDQINISFNSGSGIFALLADENSSEQDFDSYDPVIPLVMKRVDIIPRKRFLMLRDEIDRWMDQGLTMSQIVANMNKILQSEFKGGSITHTELKEAMKYVMLQRGGSA